MFETFLHNRRFWTSLFRMADFLKIAKATALVAATVPGAAYAQEINNIETKPWSLFCERTDLAQSSCAIAQVIVAKQNADIKFKLALSRNPEGLLISSIRIEPRPKVESDAAIFIDGEDSGYIALHECDEAGCSSHFGVPAKLLARMFTGKIMTLQFTLNSGREVSLDANISTLTLAINALLQADAKSVGTKEIASVFGLVRPDGTQFDEFTVTLARNDSATVQLYGRESKARPSTDLLTNDSMGDKDGAVVCAGDKINNHWTFKLSNGFTPTLTAKDQSQLSSIAYAISKCGSDYALSVNYENSNRALFDQANQSQELDSLKNTIKQIDTAKKVIFTEALQKRGVQNYQILYRDERGHFPISLPDFIGNAQ